MSSLNEIPAQLPGLRWLSVSSAASTLSPDYCLGGSTTSGLLHRTLLEIVTPWTPRNLSSSQRRKVRGWTFDFSVTPLIGVSNEHFCSFSCTSIFTYISLFIYLCLRVHQQPSVEGICSTITSGETYFLAATEGSRCIQRP